MNYGQIVIFGAKLVFGGIAAFLAILLWSKTRRAGWLCLSSSVLISYAGIIYEMMVDMGILSAGNFFVYGIPVLRLCFAVVPALFLITALILIIKELS
ncbi:MAG: hypothetical protein ACI4MA_09305 [Treponema sp.]|nr:hypothetical protein [Spirochaetia bacterium]MDD7698455.1 hypothetical protein [Spirochaetia bacterium]MDY4211136.1 hypothetical protein [Treponema sp.]